MTNTIAVVIVAAVLGAVVVVVVQFVQVLRDARPPVFQAIARNRLRTLARLLRRAGAGNADHDGHSPLTYAVSRGNVEAVRVLLAHGISPKMPSPRGFYPLRIAVIGGKAEVLDLLLDHDADPNRADRVGGLPLHEAVHNGRADLVESLLAHGANPDAFSAGRSPLHIAARNGMVELVQILIRNGATRDLLSVEHRGELEAVSALAGMTPLHETLLYRKSPMESRLGSIKALLDHGADPMIRNRDGLTPLDIALQVKCLSHEPRPFEIIRPYVQEMRIELIVLGRGDGFQNHILAELRDRECDVMVLPPWMLQMAGQEGELAGFLLEWIDRCVRCICFFSAELLPLVTDARMASAFAAGRLLFVADPGDVPPDSIQRCENTVILHPDLDLRQLTQRCLFFLGFEDRCAEPAVHSDQDKEYDVFISYKSQEVATARFIAEQLVACGKRVWFAEFNILLAGRTDYQQMINRGIRSSAAAICITNERYAESAYCRIEMDQILEIIPPSRIVEVAHPDEPHRYAAVLKERQAAKVEANGDSGGLWHKIATILDVPAELPVSDLAADLRLCQMNFADLAVTVQLPAYWHVQIPPRTPHTLHDQSLADFIFRGSGFGFCGNLSAGPQLLMDHRGFVNAVAADSDRKLLMLVLETFRYLSQTKEWQPSPKCRGVHLLDAAGQGQIAFSFVSPASPGEFARLYPVYFRHPCTADLLEFCLHFTSIGAEGDFANFCRHAYLMDRLVTSVDVRCRT